MDSIDITKLNIGDIYKNTIQTIIDIINDLTFLFNDNNFKNYNQIIEIIFKNDRMFYIGVIFIILYFVIYFISMWCRFMEYISIIDFYPYVI
jgi:hypothetical protein